MVKGGYMKLEDKLSSQNKVLLWRRVVKGIYIIAMPGIGSCYSYIIAVSIYLPSFVCLHHSGSCYVLQGYTLIYKTNITFFFDIYCFTQVMKLHCLFCFTFCFKSFLFHFTLFKYAFFYFPSLKRSNFIIQRIFVIHNCVYLLVHLFLL